MSRARDLANIGWVKVFDQTLLSNATSFADVDLTRFSRYRFRVDVKVNSAVSTAVLGWRGSFDGVNFLSSAGSYSDQLLQAYNTVAASSNNSRDFGLLNSGMLSTQPAWPSIVEGSLFKGGSARIACIINTAGQYSSVPAQMKDSIFSVIGTIGTLQKIRIFTTVASALGTGSSLLVEGI